jgi:hypothetical protein
MMAIQTLITETYTHVSNLKDMYIIVIVTHLSETETQFGNLKRMHIIRMHTHISTSHRHLTSFIGVFAEIISNECIILTSFINMFVARVIGKVWPLNYRTVITEETRDMCPFTLLTSCIFTFFLPIILLTIYIGTYSPKMTPLLCHGQWYEPCYPTTGSCLM